MANGESYYGENSSTYPEKFVCKINSIPHMTFLS